MLRFAWYFIQCAGLCFFQRSQGIDTVAVAPELRRIAAAKPGDLLELPDLLQERTNMPLVRTRVAPLPSPTLLLSDKPEYFSEDGIALREDVKPGPGRLYLYHVPESAPEGKTVSVVIENLGPMSAKFQITRGGAISPGRDYQAIARAGLRSFFEASAKPAPQQIAPKSMAVFDRELDQTLAFRDELIHGFYEFEIDQPARIYVFQRDPSAISTQIVSRLKLLPQHDPRRAAGNGAGRGQFLISEISVTNEPGSILNLSEGPRQLLLAEGRTQGWLAGRDGIEGLATRNVGNYGVLYRVHLRVCFPRTNGVALLLGKMSSSSSYCGRLAAAIQVGQGVFPPAIVNLPAPPRALANPNEAVLVQRFQLGQNESERDLEFIYSPPGAACMPTPLLLVPYPL